MSLQRLGDSGTMRAIQKRIKQIQAELAGDPERTRELEAQIDADRSKIQQMHRVSAPRTAPPAAPADKYSRSAMRRKPIEE